MDTVTYPFLIRETEQGRYTAEPAGIPEISGEGPTPADAIARANEALARWSGAVYWIPVTAKPSPTAWAGHAKDDPDFDIYVEEIERYRREVDERECSSTSSTPTT